MYEYGNLNTLNIEDVLPNRFQPRIHFDENKLNELAESIRKYGVIQPIVVRQIGDKYEIIAGERRYKASKIANKSTIPAIVINLNDKESEEIALLENVQRQNLTPIEEAVSYKRILDMGYITQVELAEKLGKTQSTIANKVRLLNLDDQVQYALLNGKISERHARSLLRIHDRSKQVEMLNKIINERLTVKKTDEAIQKMLEEPKEELVSPIKEVKKKSFVKSEPVEELFGADEPIKKSNRAVPRGSHEIIRVSLPKDLEEKLMRKDEKGMDIDRIMREAQDINVPEENKDISELMKNDNSVFEMPATPVEPIVSLREPVVSNEIPLVNDEQNKFVNFNGIVGEEKQPEKEIVNNVSNNEASFDSIFNQMPTNLQTQEPVVETPVGLEPVIQSIPNSMVSNEMPAQEPAELGIPVQPVNPIGVSETIQNNEGVSIAEAVKNAMNSQLPEETSVMSPVMERQTIENVTASGEQNVESTVIPRTATIQPKTLINNENEVAKSSLYSELIQNQMPTNLQTQEPVVETPVGSEPVIQSMPNSIVSNEIPVQQSNETMQMADPTVQTIQPNPQSIVSSVSEPVITNIPDSDILEAPTSETIASNVTSNIATAQVNNNFIEVIRLIRNCANQIEKLGYKIDLDEIDLGNMYQASFKIDKQ